MYTRYTRIICINDTKRMVLASWRRFAVTLYNKYAGVQTTTNLYPYFLPKFSAFNIGCIDFPHKPLTHMGIYYAIHTNHLPQNLFCLRNSYRLNVCIFIGFAFHFFFHSEILLLLSYLFYCQLGRNGYQKYTTSVNGYSVLGFFC